MSLTNTPAQPMLTDDEIIALEIEVGGTFSQGPVPFARAIESALLSTLRAPVADERAAFEKALLRRVPNAMLIRVDMKGATRLGEYCREEIEACWRLWQDRAALASAPVAGEAQLSDDDALDILSEYGDHNVEHGRIMFDKWTLQAAGEALLQRCRAGKDGEHGK